jgi:hypothetical protein
MLDRSATCLKIQLEYETKFEEEDVEDVLAEEVIDLDDKVFLDIYRLMRRRGMKMCDECKADRWGTPRGRYDDHSSKFFP